MGKVEVENITAITTENALLHRDKDAEGSLRAFVENYLSELKDMPEGDFRSESYMGKYPGRGSVKIEGYKRADTATFDIIRTLPNGHRCSAVPVYDMYFTQDQIMAVADLAESSL